MVKKKHPTKRTNQSKKDLPYRLGLPEQVLVGRQYDTGQQSDQRLVGEDEEHLR